LPPAVTIAAHRLDGVNHLADHHPLNLHPIVSKGRQGFGESRLDRGADLNDLTPREHDRVANCVITSSRSIFGAHFSCDL
jgi:hypothetical protein